MATKRVQFFSTLDEFVLSLSRLIKAFDLCVFMYRWRSSGEIKKIECENMTQQIQAFGASRLYLAESGDVISEIDSNRLEVARLGLIQIDLPRISEKILFMSEVAVKTDWIDSTSGKRCENRQLLSFFNRVKKELLKDMKGPILGVNIVTGANSIDSTVKYTMAAQAFAEAGGELMQEGVNNIRFRPIAESEG